MKQAWKLDYKEICHAIASHVIDEHEELEGGYFRTHVVTPKDGSSSGIYAIVIYEGSEDDEALKQEADKWQCVS